MRNLLLFLFCLLLTGCFDITERISHRDNNSGDYSLVIDFSKSWFKTKSAIWLEEVDGVSIPNEEEIKGKLTEFRYTVSKIPGVSKISTSYNFETYIFKFKFTYANLDALNAVLNSMDKNTNLVHFKSVNGTFERVASYPIPTNIIKNDDKKEELLQANIIAIYSFDKEIKTANNPKVILSKSKKTAFLRNNIWNVLHNNTLMNNSITFTP